MNYTLTFTDSQKKITNPTEADIRAAFNTKVRDDLGSVFDIASGSDALQLELMAKGRFAFTYVGAEDSYASKRENFSAEEALKVMLAYRNGSPDWKSLVELKK